MLEQFQVEMKPVVIHPMEYRRILRDKTPVPQAEENAQSIPGVQELEKRIAELESELEQRSRKYEADLDVARTEAREEGRVGEQSEQGGRITEGMQQLAAALAEFATERDRYLAQVEQEVVRLALAIAERILHREAQMDPLLLTGAVRVALGQLAETTEVRLIVPEQEQELWKEMLRLMPNLPLRPQLIASAALSTTECRIETRVGNIDLGVRSQLTEIERGFFDLLDKRGEAALKTPDPAPSVREEHSSFNSKGD